MLCTLACRLYALCNGSSNGGGVERRGREEKEAEFLSFFPVESYSDRGPFIILARLELKREMEIE